VREFDPPDEEFREGRVLSAEAKGGLDWRDRDNVYVSTDFGPGSMTTSGYPRIVKDWKRGTPLSEARTVFEGESGDVSASAFVSDRFGFKRELIRRGITFYTESFTSAKVINSGSSMCPPTPTSARARVHHRHAAQGLAVGGKTYPAGSFLIQPWDKFLAAGATSNHSIRPVRASRSPVSGHLRTISSSTNSITFAANSTSSPTKARLETRATARARVWPALHRWRRRRVGRLFLDVTDFLTPTSLYYGTLARMAVNSSNSCPPTSRRRSRSLATRGRVEGRHAHSYFQVSRRGLALDGNAPTLLNAYGGFQLSQTPVYNGGRGMAWLERGGVFVLANIRGGGEFARVAPGRSQGQPPVRL